MANFQSYPGGQRISKQLVKVEGDTLTVGLWGYLDSSNQELALTNDGDDLYIERGAIAGNVRLWKIRPTAKARATKETITDTVYANPTKDDMIQFGAWDSFQVAFTYKKQAAASLIVRPVTSELLDGPPAALWRSTNVESKSVIDRAAYQASKGTGLLKFGASAKKSVKVAVFAAKYGACERAFILMTPTGPAKNLLIAISHGFGQNDKYYGDLGYADPLSKPLIRDVLNRFVLGRWGQQMMAARDDYAILMPVRAKSGQTGSEIGPFVDHAGIGAQVIQTLIAQSNGAFGVNRVGVVTFSSGIYDTNKFLAVGGKGLTVHWGINQDPAGGAQMSTLAPLRRQFLSGFTTHQIPRVGFEFLPIDRWANEPNRTTMFPNDPFNYMHTWCMPEYTLYLGMGTTA